MKKILHFSTQLWDNYQSQTNRLSVGAPPLSMTAGSPYATPRFIAWLSQYLLFHTIWSAQWLHLIVLLFQLPLRTPTELPNFLPRFRHYLGTTFASPKSIKKSWSPRFHASTANFLDWTSSLPRSPHSNRNSALPLSRPGWQLDSILYPYLGQHARRQTVIVLHIRPWRLHWSAPHLLSLSHCCWSWIQSKPNDPPWKVTSFSRALEHDFKTL